MLIKYTDLYYADKYIYTKLKWLNNFIQKKKVNCNFNLNYTFNLRTYYI